VVLQVVFVRAVVLDADGTILHSELAIYHAIKGWFERYRLIHPSYQEVIHAFRKADLKDIISALLPSDLRGNGFVDLAIGEISYSYVNLFMQKYATLVSGAFEIIHWLRLEGYSIAIVTNGNKAMLNQLLQSFGLSGLVDVALSADDSEPKPSPHGILKALKSIDAGPRQTISVGDRAVDIVAGKAAGTTTVGVLSGVGDAAELRSAGADFIIESVASLRGLLMCMRPWGNSRILRSQAEGVVKNVVG
jgi:HAD superfamily hydrolase (TIGR01509 family)